MKRLTNKDYSYDVYQFQKGEHEPIPGVKVPLTCADYNERIWFKLFEVEELGEELGISLFDFIKVVNEFYKERVTVITILNNHATVHGYVPKKVTINMKDRCFIIDNSRFFFRDYGKFWTVDSRLVESLTLKALLQSVQKGKDEDEK